MIRKLLLAGTTAAVLILPAGAAQASPTHATAASWPAVRAGAKGERVRTIQLLLNQHRVRVTVDGDFGKSTTAAVKAFQAAKRLVADGHVGPATWEKLVVPLRRGARGDAVQALQRELRYQWGYKSVAVDGAFGASTQTALRSFQTKRGLQADGVAGPASWRALVA